MSQSEPTKAKEGSFHEVKGTIKEHWGSDPGQTFTWVHLNHLIKKYDLDLNYL